MKEFAVVIEGSGKHCHVKQETLETLFGAGFELEVKKMLSQPGQYLAHQKVKVIGPRGETTMSVIGPCRKADQIELSFTDVRALGIEAPIRESGDVAGSPGCKIIGPKGEVEISEGVIIAKRHVHFTPEDAEKAQVKDKQNIKVKVESERALIFDDVVARVSPEYATYMHIDYDEVNAAAIFDPALKGIIVG
jgi:putative phosphotransacetylase